MARTLIEEHGFKAGDHCVVPAHDPSLQHIARRVAGVSAALDEAGITSEALHVGLVIDEVTSIVAEYLTANPETDCVASTGTQGTVPAALEEAGMEGLPNGDVDVNPRVMANVKGRADDRRRRPAALLAGLHANRVYRLQRSLRADPGRYGYQRRAWSRGRTPYSPRPTPEPIGSDRFVVVA